MQEIDIRFEAGQASRPLSPAIRDLDYIVNFRYVMLGHLKVMKISRDWATLVEYKTMLSVLRCMPQAA